MLCVGPPDRRPAAAGAAPDRAARPGPQHRAGRGVRAAGVTAVSLDRLPRTLSRAQSMDALTSQANIAGYKAAVLAADATAVLPDADDRGRHGPARRRCWCSAPAWPGCRRSAPPAGSARWSPATTCGPEAGRGGRSLGRPVPRPGPAPAAAAATAGTPGTLTDEERAAQQDAAAGAIAGFDVVITTAQVPGGTPPLLVTAEALKGMRPARWWSTWPPAPTAATSRARCRTATVVTGDGVTVIGAGEPAVRHGAGRVHRVRAATSARPAAH